MSFPEPGELFQERYRIEDVVGRGGFSRVYQATQVDLDRSVAIKVLEVDGDHLNADAKSRRLDVLQKRFEQEARIASQLRDERCITIHDFGRTGDSLYMVMEYVDGLTIRDLTKREGRVEPNRALAIIRDALGALGEAHRIGFLHRDVKPHNIMVFDHGDRRDRVKVLDFGLVKLIDEERVDSTGSRSDLTADGMLIGTPRYMAPEQIRGDKIGPYTDIYSLGLVLYEMLTGRLAIEGDTTMKIVARHLDAVPFSIPNDVRLPSDVIRIVLKFLAKNVDDRYATTADAIADIDSFLAGDDLGQTLDQLSIEIIDLGPVSRRPAIAGPVAGLLLVAVAVVLAAVWTQSSPDVPEPPEPPEPVVVSTAHKVELSAARPAETPPVETVPEPERPPELLDATPPTTEPAAPEPAAPAPKKRKPRKKRKPKAKTSAEARPESYRPLE